MQRQAEHDFAADHPTAPGHFPGNPVIPGAVLLDAVLTAIGTDSDRAARPCSLRVAKFLHPVRPGERMLIVWQDGPAGVSFTCSVADRPVLTGSLGR